MRQRNKAKRVNGSRRRTGKQRSSGTISAGQLYTMESLLRALRIGRNSVASAAADGLLPRHHLGRRVFFLGSDVIAWITTPDVAAVSDPQA
jgi:hypothetical protein